MINIKNAEEFVEFIDRNTIENLLMGNGFGLSHPVLSESFNFDYEYVIKHLKRILKNVPDNVKNCPEKFLEYLRKTATVQIIKKYLKQITLKDDDKKPLCDLYTEHSYSCAAFLCRFKNIFTLNYDPLMYFEFLKIHDYAKKSGRDYLEHKDGFEGNNLIEQDALIKRLKNAEKKFMYLHGSYFIHINYENDKVKKLKRHDINLQFINSSMESVEENPFLILEGQWKSKKHLIQKYKYLKYCYDTLKTDEMKNLLIFGVSFLNDDHILEAIIENKNLKEIYVTYFKETEKQIIENKITKLYDGDKRFKFIEISVENCIWSHEEVEHAFENGFDEWKGTLIHNVLEYDEWPSYIHECIQRVSDSKCIEDLDFDPNDLYYYCVKQNILGTDVMDKLVESPERFDEFKNLLLLGFKNLEIQVENL